MTTEPPSPGPTKTPPRLIVFTRFPEPGTTKTRLISLLGADGAAELQRAMTLHTLRTARRLRESSGVEIEIRFVGGSLEAMRAAFGDDASYRPQGDGDLGNRMGRALREAFEESAPSVVVIGSDCPRIHGDHFVRTLAFLSEVKGSVVLGPALDGGYYLIGMDRPRPELFEGVAWSTDRVCMQTLEAVRRLGLSYLTLEPLADVDRPEDLAVWQAALNRLDDPASPPRVTVVIPARDEEAAIGAALDSAQAAPDVEVIVADGGSRDGTVAVAIGRGALVVGGWSGRARQMNAGAARARSELLVFLHADTVLPPGYAEVVERTLAAPETVAGAFRLAIDGPLGSFGAIEFLVHLRSTLLHIPYGDQALFLRTGTFRALGGFPDSPIMEDLELVRRLRRIGAVRVAPEAVRTSARRWRDRGILRMTLLNQVCLTAYFLGVSPARIAGWRGPGRARSRPEGAS